MRAKFSMVRHGLPLLLSGLGLGAYFFLQSQRDAGDAQQAIIDQGVEIKIEEYIKRQETRCFERAVIDAVSRVDSMVRAGALEERIDPVVKPPRPDKPDMPTIKQLPDSLGHSKMLNE